MFNHIFNEDDMIKLQTLLRANNQTITTAESCTGGLVASMITKISGSSDIFNGSIVTYSNKIKNQELHVQNETLEKFGAVSTETVLEMAKGLYDLTGTDLCISVSGIAGPEGGTNEKPVGTVHFGMSFQGRLFSIKKVFDGNREDIRKRASYYALWSALKVVRNQADKSIKEWGNLSNYLSY